MDIKTLSTVAGFVVVIAGAGVGYGSLQSQVDQNTADIERCNARVDESESTIIAEIRAFRCGVEKRLGIDSLSGCG